MLGQDIYTNLPETTDKILFEVANDGHGAAAYPFGEISEYIINWLQYQVLEDNTYCSLLLNIPSTASQYLTNIECTETMFGDINEDSTVNVQDIILMVELIINNDYNIDGDMNSDSQLNILDVLLVINIILGS